ncbi:hypothetical protein BKA93DRAFT_752566 [Sparassis latifolia]
MPVAAPSSTNFSHPALAMGSAQVLPRLDDRRRPDVFKSPSVSVISSWAEGICATPKEFTGESLSLDPISCSQYTALYNALEYLLDQQSKGIVIEDYIDISKCELTRWLSTYDKVLEGTVRCAEAVSLHENGQPAEEVGHDDLPQLVE